MESVGGPLSPVACSDVRQTWWWDCGTALRCEDAAAIRKHQGVAAVVETAGDTLHLCSACLFFLSDLGSECVRVSTHLRSGSGPSLYCNRL